MFRFDFEVVGEQEDLPEEFGEHHDVRFQGIEGVADAHVHVEPFVELSLEHLARSLPSSLLVESVRLANGDAVLKRHMADVKFQVAVENHMGNETSLAEDASSAPVETAATIDGTSDLVPGVYEGGLKTWECSVDLASYLASAFPTTALAGKRILELGCGSALPSSCLLRRCPTLSALDVQDYNESVLALVTLPNLIVNSPEFAAGKAVGSAKYGCQEVALEQHSNIDEATEMELNEDYKEKSRARRRQIVAALSKRCRTFKGDWDGLASTMRNLPPSQLYDLILTSETLYSVTSVSRLCRALRVALRPPIFQGDGGGIALVAAKTFYFGVGGGTRAFCQEIERDKGELEERMQWEKTFKLRAENVWETKASGGVLREIIKVSFLHR